MPSNDILYLYLCTRIKFINTDSMKETQIATAPGTKGAWIWAIICILYALSPIDIIPDVIPVVGWADDLLAVIGGGLNLIQASVGQTNVTLAGIIKFFKWTVIILGGILVAILALFGVALYNLFK